MNIGSLQKELKSYYSARSFNALGGYDFKSPTWAVMDEFAKAHPELGPIQLKAALYETVAETFQPVLFKNSPFYSEMGVNVAECDGMALSAGSWLVRRNYHLFHDASPEEDDRYRNANAAGIHLAYSYPDIDHHCASYSRILEGGLESLYAEAQDAFGKCESDDERLFIDAAIRGLLAVKKIAGKFSLAAEKALATATEPEERRFLEMMMKAAKEVPWRKANTFYEGLCAIWFLHEVAASLDGVRIYVLGHIDRMLDGLYRRDLAAKRLTKDEAYDLLCRFLVYTDCKFADAGKPVDESFNFQELGGTIILGGCDATGEAVCNDITFMTLKAHHDLKLVYPKIHCRVSESSRQDFLDAINKDFLSGRNVISFLNDDGIIPAQVRAGKRLEDARLYVAGGCWEVMLEGHEHSAGANCYFNLAKIVDMSIHEDSELEKATGVVCRKLDGKESFEEVRQTILDNIVLAIRRMCESIRDIGRIWPQVNPSPFFSSCLADCLANRKDYTAGGGRYNPHGLPLTNFSPLVNSLLAIKSLCFDAKRHSLSEILRAVRNDWEGFSALRAEALACSRFGDGEAESNALAKGLLDEIHERTRDLKNERGGPFQLGFYSYRDVVDWAPRVRATPDGRRKGDFLAQGLTPSRGGKAIAITSAINAAAALDLKKCPANSVMTLSLPLTGLGAQTLAQVERAYAASGLGMLQLNCVDKQTLLDAQAHPEQHGDLIVRLYGYSARFVNLTSEMQAEFISRNVYGEPK